MRAISAIALGGLVVVAGCHHRKPIGPGPVAHDFSGNVDDMTDDTVPSGDSGDGGGGTGGMPIDMAGLDCGKQNFTINRINPNLLIILDKSGSMNDPPNSSGVTADFAATKSKWVQVTEALDLTVMQSQAQLNWGIEFFPADDFCAVETSISVPVAPMAYAAISAALKAHKAAGATPTAAAVNAGATSVKAITLPGEKYMLLTTDGDPNCLCPAPGYINKDGLCCMPSDMGREDCKQVGDDPDGAVNAVAAAAAAGIKTFVLGVATGPSSVTVLNRMAQAGQTPRPGGNPDYYPINNSADLVSTVNAIARSLISCTLPLQAMPPDPKQVKVALGTHDVPRDPARTDGFELGTNKLSIQLYGSWCEKYKDNNLGELKVEFGCPPLGYSP